MFYVNELEKLLIYLRVAPVRVFFNILWLFWVFCSLFFFLWSLETSVGLSLLWLSQGGSVFFSSFQA